MNLHIILQNFAILFMFGITGLILILFAIDQFKYNKSIFLWTLIAGLVNIGIVVILLAYWINS